MMEPCLLRLSTRAGEHQVSEDIGDEIAARQIVMRQIVERIDAKLAVHLSLEGIATTVGLSPGRFARKFHHSAGLSLGRFMNKRRIGMSFAMLRKGTLPLSRIALDLGFSSQSDFTRLFSSHTGVAP